MRQKSALDPLRQIVEKLPLTPGVYLMKDAAGGILYIGKEKALKKRVRSYLTDRGMPKITVLMSKVRSIDHISTPSEVDALLLEAHLIKKYQPRYNILLKDDKTFPWICIKNEPFPRVFSTRNVFKDGSVYLNGETAAPQ